jgi:rod shape-determining protein MreD
MLEILRHPLLRLLMIGLPVLALQNTLLAEMRPFGVSIQAMLLLAVAGGVAGGPERGALAGFVMGLLYDLVLTSPLGLHALVYGLAAFLAGYINSLTRDHPRWLVMVVVAVASAASTVAYPVALSMIGEEVAFTSALVKVTIVVTVANVVFAVPAVWLMRWALHVQEPDAPLAIRDDVP